MKDEDKTARQPIHEPTPLRQQGAEPESSASDRARGQRQAALLRLSGELAAAVDEAEVCRRIVEGLRDTLGYDVVAVYLVDETTGDRVNVASVGFDEPPDRVPSGRGVSESALQSGQFYYTPDTSQDPRDFYGMGGSAQDV